MSAQLCKAILVGLISCTAGAEPTELLPGVWVDEGVVEFNASVAMDCHHPETPDVYLEMLITGPDTREHESLLVSTIKPSNLHAGLLAAGFDPGAPVKTDDSGNRTAATGDALTIEVRVGEDGEWSPLIAWVVTVEDGDPLEADSSWTGLVFAGSAVVEGKGYIADREGGLVSLTPFGFEVVSPAWLVSPDASTDEPEWIADRDRVPEFKTEVRVRVRGVPDLDEDLDPAD